MNSNIRTWTLGLFPEGVEPGAALTPEAVAEDEVEGAFPGHGREDIVSSMLLKAN
jgi:hypothetical protein